MGVDSVPELSCKALCGQTAFPGAGEYPHGLKLRGLSSWWELNGWNVKLERQFTVDKEADVILPIAGNRESFWEAQQRQGIMGEKEERLLVMPRSVHYGIILPGRIKTGNGAAHSPLFMIFPWQYIVRAHHFPVP